MSKGSTEFDGKNIEAVFNKLSQGIDSAPAYPPIKKIFAQHPTDMMSLWKALNILVRETENQLPENLDKLDKKNREIVGALAKVKKYITYL